MTVISQRRATAHPMLLPLLAFSQLIIAIDYNIVVVALPGIGRELHLSEHGLQWVINAYALMFGGLLLFGGRAADVLGRRRMLVVGLALYGVSSLAATFANQPALLLAARGVQGIGGAILLPTVLATLNASWPEGPARFRALSIWSAAGAVGLAAGSLLGGVLTGAFGWRSVFAVNVPLAATALVLAAIAAPADAARDRTRKLDTIGAATATAGLLLLVFAIASGPNVGWGAFPTIATLAGGIVLLGGFWTVERRTPQPLLPARLLDNRNLTGSVATMALFMGGVGTLYYVYTLFLQGTLHLSVMKTGLAFLPWALVGLAGSRLAGWMLGRVGIRASLGWGTSLAAGGAAALSFAMALEGNYWWTLPGVVVLALGQGVGFASVFAAAGVGVAAEEQGVAAGLASTAQQVGSALGLACVLAVAAAVAPSDSGAVSLPAAAIVAAALLLVARLAARIVAPGHKSRN